MSNQSSKINIHRDFFVYPVGGSPNLNPEFVTKLKTLGNAEILGFSEKEDKILINVESEDTKKKILQEFGNEANHFVIRIKPNNL